MKRIKYLILSLFLLFLVFCCLFRSSFFRPKVINVSPYITCDQIVSDVRALPVIGIDSTKTTSQDWVLYVSMARRLKVTDPVVVKLGLRQSGDEAKDAWPSQVKILVLLGVCFDVPSGEFPSYIRGVWLSDSALRAGRTIQSEDWPVERSSGQFYLEDTISGYDGKPYDPEMDFQWRLTNGKWRDL